MVPLKDPNTSSMHYEACLCHNTHRCTACHMERLYVSCIKAHLSHCYTQYPACIYMSDRILKCLAVCLSSCTVSMWVLIAICHSCTVIALVTAVKATCLHDCDYSMQTVAAYARDSRDIHHFWLPSSSLFNKIYTVV